MSDLPISTSDVKKEVAIRLGKDGQSALPPTTVMENLDSIVERHGDKNALFQKRPAEGVSADDTPWTKWTWREYRNQVHGFGKALLTLGFERFDIINIIGFNSPEWFFANFGAMAAGGVAAGIYSTNNSGACKYITEHSKAKVVVCEGLKQLEKYYKICKELPELKALVVYGVDKIEADVAKNCAVPVYTFEDFVALGKDVSDDDLNARSSSWKPGETCTLIYTSGTTGPPKAVMITNDNITWTVRTMLTTTRKGSMDTTDVMISYLPLSHIAAQMLDMHMPMATGCQIYFAQPDALKGSLGNTLREVRPTTFFGVPRVWEKIYEKLQEVGKATTGVKKILSTWAKGEAEAYWKSMDYDGLKEFSITRSAPVSYMLAQVLLKQAHIKLGLDRCYGFYVSAAPIEPKILRYFSSIDIPIMELFGQSECTGPHSVNTYVAFKIGTVGRPMLGTETKLDSGNGELCYRGRHIFAGYMGMPDKTKEAIDPEGWLHSGDVVKIDDDTDARIEGPSGFISITGRIKEILITAGGENVAPVLIENEMKAAMPALSNAMVIGDKRKFLTVVFCLRVDIDADGAPTNKLTGTALEVCKEIGSSATTTDEARNDPKWVAYFDEGVKKANTKAISKAQNVAKWALLPTDFTEKGTELTPTLKLKRSVAAAKYADVIEAMYA